MTHATMVKMNVSFKIPHLLDFYHEEPLARDYPSSEAFEFDGRRTTLHVCKAARGRLSSLAFQYFTRWQEGTATFMFAIVALSFI